MVIVALVMRDVIMGRRRKGLLGRGVLRARRIARKVGRVMLVCMPLDGHDLQV